MAQLVLYSPRQFDLIREAAKVVVECHHLIREMIKPGVTTKQIDTVLAKHIRERGGVSPFLGYELAGKEPFPASICASVNDVVVHGVPDDRPLEPGDLASIDIGVRKNGYIGDSGWTYAVGGMECLDERRRKLMLAGEQALREGLKALAPNGRIKQVSRAIQTYVEAHGFSVVREYVGHGVGQNLHEEPQVPNYVQTSSFFSLGQKVKPGMCLAIEPMVNEGTYEVKSTPGRWPVHTADNLLSVHFEHTVAIYKDHIEILTLKDGDWNI